MNTLRVVLNGVPMDVQSGTTVAALLELVNESNRPDMLVEINHRFIHTNSYPSTLLHDDDQIEIIHMAMGG